jgi:hypothetical protein
MRRGGVVFSLLLNTFAQLFCSNLGSHGGQQEPWLGMRVVLFQCLYILCTNE